MTWLNVRIGPFSVHFTNVNRAMNLPGHSHFATVDLYFIAPDSDDSLGFPSFAKTHAVFQQALTEYTSRPLRDHTNERIAREMFALVDGLKSAVIDAFGIEYALMRLDLNVRGVPDAIGHADSFTTYSVNR
jgi:hypothetical protein